MTSVEPSSSDSLQGASGRPRTRPSGRPNSNEPTVGGGPMVPEFGAWNKNPEQAEGYTDVFNQVLSDKKTPGRNSASTPHNPLYTPKKTKQSKVLKFGSTTADVPKLGKWEVEEAPYADQRYDYLREAMSIPNEPQMNCDAGTSQGTKLIPPHVAMTREVGKSKRADAGCNISSADFDTNPDAIKSGGGVLIERSRLHRRMGGRGSGCQTSSFDGSAARPAQSRARTGTGNIEYKAMDKLKQRLCYAVSYKKNIGVLQTKIQLLMEEIAEVQSVLISEGNYGMDGVQHWLSQADEILKEANGVVEGRNNMADKKRMCSPCWDPTSSWETGEMLRHIDNILEERKGLDLSSYFCGLSYCKKLQSRESILQQILEDLMGTHINVIGIYGMIGVGKTVLSKELAKRVRNNKLYDDIVMVLVSEPLDVKLIQAQIANKIGLQLSEADDEETRAHILYNKLDEKVVECGEETIIEPIQQAKILVILDGMWSVSDLRKVGIPYKQEGKSRCKVVLISRNADVCREMGAEKNFLVECLNVDEAKILFQDKIESMEVTLESERYEYVENVILTKCGGLPLMINSLACTLRSMSQSNWEVVADQMERQSLLEVDEAKEVPCAILELCNRFIQNGGKQKLFLLCCLLIQQGGDVPLEKLMRYGIGLGLFEVDSLASVDEQINSWVHELKSLSLLLESEKPHHVKMHHLIQDVAILALSQGDNILPVLVEAGTGWHSRDSFENCVAISMAPDSNYKCLNGLELPKLEVLWLKGIPSLSLPVPGTFFQGMQNLKILEMYGMTCELPSCMGDMKNLVTLHLESCCIKDGVLSIIYANLERLEVLSLHGSTFEGLPEEIGNLTNLRVLDLTDCKSDTFSVAGVAKLNRLRELYLSGSNTWKWSTGDMEKWAHLPLEAFEIEVAYTSKVSPGALSFPNLRRFVISDLGMPRRGYASGQDPSSNYSRAILINTSYYPQFEKRHWVNVFLPTTEYLQIRGVKGLVKGIGELNIQGFPQLKNLYVEGCVGMKCMLDATNLSMIQQTQIFPELEVLTLRNLDVLTSICCPQPCYSLFPRLRELRLERVDRLCPHVLPIQLAVKLRVLEVSYCPSLLHIFEIDETHHGASVDELPFLEKLELRYLDALQDVCNKKIKFPSLKEIHLEGRVFQIGNLWDFSGSKDPYEERPCFGNLKYMTISGCEDLESLFPSHMVNSLLQLEKLVVMYCIKMKEVITSTNVGDDNNPSTMITFPKLQILKLECLINLQCFYRGGLRLHFPVLRELELIDLRQMKEFTLPNNHSFQTESTVCCDGQIDSVSLEHPQVSEIDFELLQRHSETTTFPNLSRLALKDLPNLKALPNINSKTLRILSLEGMDSLRVFSSVQPSYKPSMPLLMSWELEELTLLDFESVEELFYNEKSVDIRHQFDHVKLFVSLRKLELWDLRLPKMIPWNVLANLSSLIIYELNEYCTSLISTALLLGGGVLPLLEYMEIEKSESLEAIISREEKEDEDVLKYGITLFPSLRHIELHRLHKLESFSMGSYEAHFPSLETLVIESCFRMRSFSVGTLRTPRLKHVKLNSKTMEADTFDDLNAVVNAVWRSARELEKKMEARHKKPYGNAGASKEDLGEIYNLDTARKGLYAADATEVPKELGSWTASKGKGLGDVEAEDLGAVTKTSYIMKGFRALRKKKPL